MAALLLRGPLLPALPAESSSPTSDAAADLDTAALPSVPEFLDAAFACASSASDTKLAAEEATDAAGADAAAAEATAGTAAAAAGTV